VLGTTQAREGSDPRFLRTLTEILGRTLRAKGRDVPAFDETTPLLDGGLIDSQGLLDLILELETTCGRVFDPDRVDFAGELTLGMLAHGFT
jgi:hypothetical protein